ncbi:hypothetical protein WS71_22400 [Burkholderia mayonis]|uniref:Uncharacterized protein n=1 Tax=Burkholderia mayonis TaxID=1385591 RepID=A0A1B4G253_9BURK|nr:hypothetical protein WS71_22400 [Burkholderia mayonis]
MPDKGIGSLFHDEVTTIGHDRAQQIHGVIAHGDQRRVAGGEFGADGEHQHRQLALRALPILVDRLRDGAVIGKTAAQAAGSRIGFDVNIDGHTVARERPAVEHELQISPFTPGDQHLGQVGQLIEHEMPEDDVFFRRDEDRRRGSQPGITASVSASASSVQSPTLSGAGQACDNRYLAQICSWRHPAGMAAGLRSLRQLDFCAFPCCGSRLATRGSSTVILRLISEALFPPHCLRAAETMLANRLVHERPVSPEAGLSGITCARFLSSRRIASICARS